MNVDRPAENEVPGCLTKTDRELLEGYFRQIAWVIARRNYLQLTGGWNVETELADGRKVKYKFKVSGYAK